MNPEALSRCAAEINSLWRAHCVRHGCPIENSPDDALVASVIDRYNTNGEERAS